MRNRYPTPDTAKCRSTRVKNVLGIQFRVRYDAGWRYPPNPALGPLLCLDGRRIIHADCTVIFDDLPPSFGDLPFQGVTGQSFGRCSLPNITPEIFLAFGALACLDALGHALKLVPRFWRVVIAIFAENVGSYFQYTYLSPKTISHIIPTHSSTRHPS